jgi:hypothetical protein
MARREEMHTKILVGIFMENVGINEMIIPKFVSKKQDMEDEKWVEPVRDEVQCYISFRPSGYSNNKISLPTN